MGLSKALTAARAQLDRLAAKTQGPALLKSALFVGV